MALISRQKVLINNDFYDDLHDDWYHRNDHPIALLRAENAVRIPWIIREVEALPAKLPKILDIGCGGGLLTNALAAKGFDVTGIDLSPTSLEIARKFDNSKSVKYMHANAYKLPFSDEMFDVVCAMDILEHVDDPAKLIAEASRVLKPNGLFFFHTFNRNPFSYLLVIKGIDWFVPHAPKNMHVYHLFIKPHELGKMCALSHLTVNYLSGFAPQIFGKSIFNLIFKRQLNDKFPFEFVKSLMTGYCGIAIKSISTIQPTKQCK